ncbi:aminotransferase class III-fold pyridoxal phosphate-dependent enzyme [Sphingobium sp. TB-6]|uniref:aminotransferase class III-fold pyridoxal phosphate-dependent enzyme n=1 Tax=Sphingobium sp. TB-6 TaxID=2728850 RepID=UPI000B3CD35C|nr:MULTISPECIES: aminotransferase class III-fold pyridoxal phosphate-dependent enzyme [Sphingomonadaceae]NML90662.1 aminotransferase class III-fold pyridoxal phosphate-dependent enzyme [Sphingobium sp. TB-6]
MSTEALTDEALRARAMRVVPNGVYGHLSNGLMPHGTPQFFVRGKGARLWDVAGREYLDFACAYGPNLLGYNDPRIEEAAQRQRALGDTLTGPAPVFVELAERLVAQVNHADWAMFAKNGTDATTMAMTIARAQTGHRKVLVATGAYHGAAPWCSPFPAGTVPEDRAHLIYYTYNDAESLETAVKAAGEDLAAIFASPHKHDVFADQQPLDREYAERCRALCDKTGAILIVDDVRAGFRIARDCSWEVVGVRPDLSCWSKAIANGYPLAALLGSDRVREGAAKVYVTGSFWFQAVPMAAALATLEVIQTTSYLEDMVKLGTALRAGIDAQAHAHGFSIRQTGPVQMPILLFDDDPDMRLGAAFAGGMIARGIYFHPWHNMFLCAAMTDDDMAQVIDAAGETFAAMDSERAKIQPHPGIAGFMAGFAAG